MLYGQMLVKSVNKIQVQSKMMEHYGYGDVMNMEISDEIMQVTTTTLQLDQDHHQFK